MRTYIFTYKHGNNDVNGNPRHWITVFRVKNNIPIRLGEGNVDVGYRGDLQAACDVIQDNERAWKNKPNVHYPNGFNPNAVYDAQHKGEINVIQISNVKVR